MHAKETKQWTHKEGIFHCHFQACWDKDLENCSEEVPQKQLHCHISEFHAGRVGVSWRGHATWQCFEEHSESIIDMPLGSYTLVHMLLVVWGSSQQYIFGQRVSNLVWIQGRLALKSGCHCFSLSPSSSTGKAPTADYHKSPPPLKSCPTKLWWSFLSPPCSWLQEPDPACGP